MRSATNLVQFLGFFACTFCVHFFTQSSLIFLQQPLRLLALLILSSANQRKTLIHWRHRRIHSVSYYATVEPSTCPNRVITVVAGLLVRSHTLYTVILEYIKTRPNSLPSGIRDSSSTHTFRRLLKTHCFKQAFGSP